MASCKFLVLTLLQFALFACNQTSKQTDNVNKIETTKGETTKSVFINSNNSSKNADSSINKDEAEVKMINAIFKLTEVKERAKYIEEQTNGKRHLKIWVGSRPHMPDQKYYWIKAGEDNGSNLVTHFNFYVYPDSMRIMYYNTESDSEIPLNKWRKNSNEY